MSWLWSLFCSTVSRGGAAVSGLIRRRLPIGAEPSSGGVHLRVWAPARKSVELVMGPYRTLSLKADNAGYFSGVAEFAKPGMQYQFRLDEGDRLFPDPASRFQPDGPHGPSEIVDPSVYQWKDEGWRGIRIEGQVLYEM